MRKERFLIILLAAGLFYLTPVALADWSAAHRLTWTSGVSGAPDIAIDSSDTIHVVWSDDTPGNNEIYYKRSTDGGTTWSAAKRIAWTAGNSLSPAMAIDSSETLHVVWADYTPGNYELYYKSSADAGTTWSAAQRLTWTSGDSYAPAIAIDPSETLHVVWYDYTPGKTEIYHKSSADAGTTWSAAKRITWTSGWSGGAAIAIDLSDAIHIVWEDDTPGNTEIYYKGSADGGSTWSAAKRITWTPSKSYGPAITTDSSDAIHVVWSDLTPGNMEIYYKGSADGGSTWSASKRLTWTSGTSSSPVIAKDSGDIIHVAWSDYTPGNPEIYYKSSPDGGSTWSATTRITWTSGISHSTAIAIDSSDAIHVVWANDTPGNYEIYYKKGT